ncbi:MAG: AAA family ATPase [Bacteroidetes bacterium GWD2_45_23]|nr:MAG: AAA family ATPase [Bacteroidetes bacterium GWC2_46_850]OFX82524.1 MAG: AAA family ATPase [Bacteroidetes bacterium GWD2_45_23]HAR37344.1 AAA family ATPase [Porphyromonadaceae bacterium]HBB01183.1 AAA family ATPase [Porphyromonadaceae bacterium]HCC18686.1 AAA family ATPase [Porphyromonadaceae bacterium]
MEKKYIKRDLSDVMLEMYQYFPVITITGPRQSGKTTLLRKVFNQLPYYSLENLDTRRFALNDPVGFLSEHSEGMILDEVQNAPSLLSYIQGLVDENPKKRFVLSGSSQFSVIKQITQSLAGRTGVLELLPLSYREVKEMADQETLDSILLKGFYPALYAGKNIYTLFYPSYVKTYLERDVRDLLQIKDMMQFQIFLRLCAGRIGSLFNASELSGEVGVSANTIKSWLSVLQASYIITLLPPFYENTRKRLTKTPKLYFCDTGLACYLLGIEREQQLARDKMRGHLFENFIVSEALKSRYNQGKESNLYFYRDSNGVEVDLLLKNGSEYTAIEIKSSQTYHPDFETGIRSLSDLMKERLANKIILYAGDFENTAAEIQLLNYKRMSTLF